MSTYTLIWGLALLLLVLCSCSQSRAAESARWEQALLDDCSSGSRLSSIGTDWFASLDAETGGQSSLETSFADGLLKVRGSIKPGWPWMGPGRAGLVLPFGDKEEVFDVSAWTGLRLRIKASGPGLLLRLHSSDIRNGDYFAVDIPASTDFVSYDFPFQQMGQVMSAQKDWQGKQASGIELIAWSFRKAEYAWELDSIEFYK